MRQSGHWVQEEQGLSKIELPTRQTAAMHLDLGVSARMVRYWSQGACVPRSDSIRKVIFELLEVRGGESA